MSALTHLAGVDVQIGTQLRQRCSWCGAVLIDEDLSMTAVALQPCEACAGTGITPTFDPPPTNCESCDGSGYAPPAPYPTWAVGAFVTVDGAASYVVDPIPSEEPGALEGSMSTPLDCCARLDPAVTA